MRNYISKVFVFAFGLALLSCVDHNFNVAIEGNDPFHPGFIFSEPITYFEILTTPTGEEYYDTVPIWEIESKINRTSFITQIRYGAYPDGFTETVRPAYLEEGKSYLAIAKNIRNINGEDITGAGAVEFMIIKESGTYRLQILE